MTTYTAPKVLKFLATLDTNKQRKPGFLDLLFATYTRYNDKYQAIMEATNGFPVGVEFKTPTADRWAFIAHEMSNPDEGSYRTQYFDQHGFYYHLTCDTLDLAIENLIENGFFMIDAGKLDQVSSAYTWKRGMAFTELQNKVNFKRISQSQANEEFERWILKNPNTIS